MEYKTVRGGDEFLPLARNLVRKLRATGLSQAAQKVNVGNVSITVRIADENDFISIEGGAPDILSGIIKVGEVVSVPADPGPPVVAAYDTLRALKPTQNCWETTLRKSASLPTGVFSDIKRLAKTGTQYADLVPSMFSGLMAKVVQVLLGRGVEVKYDYKFDKGHGVVLDNKGKPWLVEISKTNGVIAQKLGIVRVPPSANEKNDALRECVELFGGVPTGKPFPKDVDLPAAIEAKTVLRLADAGDMAPFFDKQAFASWAGWSFDQDHTARHTCFDVTEDGTQSYLYELVISITQTDTINGTVTAGDAALSQIETGFLKLLTVDADPFSWNHAASGVVRFAVTNSLGYPAIGCFPGDRVPSYSGATTYAPVWVVHNGVAFDTLRLVMQPAYSESVGGVLPPPGNYSAAFTNYYEAMYMTSSLNPQPRAGYREYASVSYGGSKGTCPNYPDLLPSGYPRYGYTHWSDTESEEGAKTFGPSYGVAVNGTRDCYVLFLQGDYHVRTLYHGINTGLWFVEDSSAEFAIRLPPLPPNDPPPPQYGTVEGPTVISDPNDVTRIVLTNEVVIIQNPDMSYFDEDAVRYSWAHPLVTPPEVVGPRFSVRSSAFPKDHFEYSANIWAVTAKCQGSNFIPGAEDLPPSTYNFIGYLA